jgi:hypothetical protein
MATDLAGGYVANYAFVTPDADQDAHNGTLQEADQWLQANVPAILARPEFGPGGDGILFIVWDEGDMVADSRCSATVPLGCGGRVATLVMGPKVRPGYKSGITYHSENVLKTVCAAMALPACPGAAQNAAPMADFFDTSSMAAVAPQNIAISNPGNGETIAGLVHLVASASENQTVSQTQVWDNGVKLGVYGTSIDAIYNLAPGPHVTWVLDLDTSYRVIHAASVSYNVTPLLNGLEIISPALNQLISSTSVHVQAAANEPVPIGQMQVWDNRVKLGWYPGGWVDHFYTLAPGLHTVTVFDLDTNGVALHESSVFYLVL